MTMYIYIFTLVRFGQNIPSKKKKKKKKEQQTVLLEHISCKILLPGKYSDIPEQFSILYWYFVLASSLR